MITVEEVGTWHIHITGQVQGVGFRPYVYQFAHQYGLAGWVHNSTDGVHIEFNADEALSQKFYLELVTKAPALSHITAHCLRKTASVAYTGFRIIASSHDGPPVQLISPDFTICERCTGEMEDTTNRRYNYAFITCTQCGPRYSIINALPYDRNFTAMRNFRMCLNCWKEFNDPLNRRHFSQTNSCPQCGVSMRLHDKDQNVIEEEQVQILKKTALLWNAGKIVAIKGIGGYVLTCDASNEMAVHELRKRKTRPEKPFALMFPDLGLLGNMVCLDECQKRALSSVAAPIVLVPIKKDAINKLPFNAIAPRLSTIGALLPYAPLYQLLLQQFGKPIVATSGNAGNAPIIYQDEKALTDLAKIADYILVHNREIIVPQDDSVLAFTRHNHHQITIRRAKGFAPLFSHRKPALPETTALAMGALLKSTFSLLHQSNVHIIQYLGNTGDYDAQITYKKMLHHYVRLFKAKPEVVLVDKHPDYFSSHLGAQLAKTWKVPLVKVQHHEAHFASVLGENDLLDASDPVLGIVWDGMGLGNDNQIWGGEFFIYRQKQMERVNHFDYFNHFLGDKMAYETSLSSFAICHCSKEARPLLQPKFTASEWENYNLLIKQNVLKTSSAGRIFDAAASLLGLIDKTSYEGQAAMLLEEEALQYFNEGLKVPAKWLYDTIDAKALSAESLLGQTARKIRNGESKPEIAAWFHVQLVWIARTVAARHQCRKICFSGGVFQNGLLVDLMMQLLQPQFQVYFHQRLSPNDENISFGQLMCYENSKNFRNSI